MLKFLRLLGMIGMLLPAFITPLCAEQGAQGKSKVSLRQPYMVLKLKDRGFEEVLDDLKKAIQLNNYFYSGVSTIDEGARRVMKVVEGMEANFEHYKIVRFCNIRRALALLKASLYAGAYLPCRFAVFVPKGSTDVFVTTIRPTVIGKIFGSLDVQNALQALEADFVQILETLNDL